MNCIASKQTHINVNSKCRTAQKIYVNSKCLFNLYSTRHFHRMFVLEKSKSLSFIVFFLPSRNFNISFSFACFKTIYLTNVYVCLQSMYVCVCILHTRMCILYVIFVRVNTVIKFEIFTRNLSVVLKNNSYSILHVYLI